MIIEGLRSRPCHGVICDRLSFSQTCFANGLCWDVGTGILSWLDTPCILAVAKCSDIRHEPSQGLITYFVNYLKRPTGIEGVPFCAIGMCFASFSAHFDVLLSSLLCSSQMMFCFLEVYDILLLRKIILYPEDMVAHQCPFGSPDMQQLSYSDFGFLML